MKFISHRILLASAVATLNLCGMFAEIPWSSEKTTDRAVSRQDSIIAALDYHFRQHPYSHYRDIYKSFMQDYFGPGHLLIDPEKSARYLRQELAEAENMEGPIAEPTGWRGSFLRVNLSLIKDSVVPFDTFFATFLESARTVVPPPAQEWKRIWSEVDSVIDVSGLVFINQASERQELREQFERGDFVVHHSQEFNDSSRYHYRIISRDLFEMKIRPLLRTVSGSEEWKSEEWK